MSARFVLLLLVGDTEAPSGLLARLCHSYLVEHLKIVLYRPIVHYKTTTVFICTSYVSNFKLTQYSRCKLSVSSRNVSLICIETSV